jgi:hypothetical protein
METRTAYRNSKENVSFLEGLVKQSRKYIIFLEVGVSRYLPRNINFLDGLLSLAKCPCVATEI